MLDFTPLRNQEKTIQELARGLTNADLAALTTEMVERQLQLLEGARDADVAMIPDDPEAKDTFAASESEIGLAWTLGHVIVHTTASSEEAAAQALVTRDEAVIARRDLRARAIVAWLELARADTDVVTQSAAATQAAELERIAQGRFDAGAGGEVDVTSAHAARARAEVAVAAAKRETRARAAELAGLLGWDPTIERHATGAVPGGAAELAQLRGVLSHHPERAAALAQITAHEATEHRLEVARRPGLAFELTGSYDDPTQLGSTPLDKSDVFAGLAFELPLFGHLGDQLRAAHAETDAAKVRLVGVDAELAAGLVAAYQRWQAAVERMVALEQDVMPAQQRATQLAQQAYREGARDLSTALLATRDQQAVAAELANARIESGLAWQAVTLAAGTDAP